MKRKSSPHKLHFREMCLQSTAKNQKACYWPITHLALFHMIGVFKDPRMTNLGMEQDF